MVNKSQRDFYEKLVSTVNLFSKSGTITLAILGAFIAVVAVLGYRKLNDLVKDAMRPVSKKFDDADREYKESKRWHDDAKSEYKELKDKLKEDKKTIEKLTSETKAQIEYMQGIDILRNTNTSVESLLRAIFLLESSIKSHSYDITRVSLAAAYKYMGNYQAAFSQFQNLSEPNQLSSEGAAAFLEIAVLVGNKMEFDRVDSKYNDTLKGFQTSLFLPLMEAVMAFLQGDTEEMNRLLDKNNRKIRTYIDDAIYEETRNEKKMFMWELNTLKTHLKNDYSTKKGFQELKEHMDLLENREVSKNCVNAPG